MGGDGSPEQHKISIPALMISRQAGTVIRRTLRRGPAHVTFSTHQFNQQVAAADVVPPEPSLHGSVTDFEFFGRVDWGVHVLKLKDGNYQLMLIGKRFNRESKDAEQSVNPSGTVDPAAKDAVQPRECHVQDRWPRTHKCRQNSDCGIDSQTCEQRSCVSMISVRQIIMIQRS